MDLSRGAEEPEEVRMGRSPYRQWEIATGVVAVCTYLGIGVATTVRAFADHAWEYLLLTGVLAGLTAFDFRKLMRLLRQK